MTTYDLVAGTEYGDKTIQGHLDMTQSTSLSVSSITVGNSPYNLSGEIVLLCNTSGGDIVVQLPTIANAPRRWYIIKKTDMTGNKITVTATGGNTINGAFTFDIQSEISIEIVNTGVGNDWSILTNLVTTASNDIGVDSREVRNLVGGAQNPSLTQTVSEMTIGAGGATGTLANGLALGQRKTIVIVDIIKSWCRQLRSNSSKFPGCRKIHSYF